MNSCFPGLGACVCMCTCMQMQLLYNYMDLSLVYLLLSEGSLGTTKQEKELYLPWSPFQSGACQAFSASLALARPSYLRAPASSYATARWLHQIGCGWLLQPRQSYQLSGMKGKLSYRSVRWSGTQRTLFLVGIVINVQRASLHF